MYKINFINYFTEEEKSKILEYVKNNIEDLELKNGYNCSIDVSEAIGRTANIDIELNQDSKKCYKKTI